MSKTFTDDELDSILRTPSHNTFSDAELDSLFSKSATPVDLVRPVPGPKTKLTPSEERQFMLWFQNWAKRAGIDPDPDNPLHKYDSRAAFKAGVEPKIDPSDGLYHWPSKYKAADHPNRFVKGVDTITGKPVATPPSKPAPTVISPYESLKLGPVSIGDVIGATAGVISQETGVAFAPLRKAHGAIERQAAEYESEFSPDDPHYALAAGLSEARRRALNISSEILLDPTNLLPLGTLMKGARWGVRLAADALFVGIAETGTIQAIKEGRYDDAAVQQAFALVGLGAAAKGKKNLVLQETKRRLEAKAENARTDAQVAADVQSYEKWSQTQGKKSRKAEAATRPNQAARRKTLEVPETTIPEDPTLRFSEAELEALTRPEGTVKAAAPVSAPPPLREKPPSTRKTELFGAETPALELTPEKVTKPLTQFDRIVDDAAESRMAQWAEDAAHAQERLSGRRGESATTMASNAEGKIIEGTANALANQVGRSLGAKEGSPLAKFTEAPSQIIKAINGTRGKLRDRVKAAFSEAIIDSDSAQIREFLKRPDDQKRALFGDDFITLEKGESAPLLGTTAEEAAALAAVGRRPELLKEGKTFDETRLVGSELFQGRGGAQKLLEEADISFNFGENIVKKLDSQIEQSNARIKKLFGGAGTGETAGMALHIRLTGELVANGALRIARGTVKFTDWSAQMVADFGERVRPYLRDAYQQAMTRARVAKESGLSSGPRLEAILSSGEDPVAKLTQAVKQAGRSREELEAAYRTERAKRIENVKEAQARGEGERSFRESLGALKGEMAADKKAMATLKLDQADVDALYNEINLHPKLDAWDKITVSDGLRQLLSGRVPKQSQIDLLKDVFGTDLIKSMNKRRPFLMKAGTLLQEAVNLPRALIASFDMSAVLRQGILLTATRPKAAVAASKEMFRQVFSEKNFNAWLEDLLNHPDYPLMKKSGLYIADPRRASLSTKEERFMSHFADKIPWVAASNRAYTGYLNKIRVDVFSQLARKFQQEGFNQEKQPKVYEDLARFVNNATGRGELPPGLNRIPQTLNTIFFSPRLIAARFNMLNPQWYFKQSPVVRKEALKTMGEFIGIGTTVLALAKANGAEVELDPRSTDFGKIKVGKTRWDIWGGFQQWVRSVSQIASGYRKTGKGDVMKLAANEFPYDSRLSVSARFIRGKLAPVPALGLELLEGQKLFGERLTLEGEAIDNAVPLYLQDIKEAVNEMGPEAIFTVGVPGFFGVGVQSYRERPPQGAIHSQLVDHISDPAVDAIMKAQVTVGPVARKKDRDGKDTETAVEYALRQELVGKFINERVWVTSHDIGFAGLTEDKKRAKIEAAIKNGRDRAKTITSSRIKGKIADLDKLHLARTRK